ncbi:SprT family zinc-dependent metalloprotease [Sphingomonas flavescens]|uniref:M48 family metallopeptidase n=1 Tax=Sphingomonas flavescens TaxID=3132797 RepID=UPI002805A665|nr:SprT family zinc-dependent metalloprotease [Sphingomonas limnosediminicola]
MWSTGLSEAALEAALPAPIEIRPLRTARRLRLRFDEASGTLRLTCPARTSRRKALAWVLDQRDWIEAQLARSQPPEPFINGSSFPLEGREVQIEWKPDHPRSPRLVGNALQVGGPETGLSRRIELFLKMRSLDVMSTEVAEYARAAGVSSTRVTVGDAGTRWGSCSSAGRIRLSWRLIMAPPNVRRFVVAHEVAHLVHLDHSARFKALEAKLYGPGLAAAKSELRRVGPRLKRIGRRR